MRLLTKCYLVNKVQIDTVKGHLISKCLFGVFNFSKENERKQVDLRYDSSKVEIFVPFLGELRIPKSPFEIN